MRPPAFAPRLAAAASTALLALAACGGGQESLRPTPLPVEAGPREAALDDLGRRLHALYRGAPESSVVLAPRDLDAVLAPRAAARAARGPTTAGGHVGEADRLLLGEARYLGACLQGLRPEPAGGPLGLRADGWVFERALVVGLQPGRRRVAAWVEGVFVHTASGFQAIALRRLERPRWEHSDLDLAPCDMAAGRWDPRHIGMVTE